MLQRRADGTPGWTCGPVDTHRAGFVTYQAAVTPESDIPRLRLVR